MADWLTDILGSSSSDNTNMDWGNIDDMNYSSPDTDAWDYANMNWGNIDDMNYSSPDSTDVGGVFSGISQDVLSKLLPLLQGASGSSGTLLDKLSALGKLAGQTASTIPQKFESKATLYDTMYPQTIDAANKMLSINVPDVSASLDPAMANAEGKISGAYNKASSDLDLFATNTLMPTALRSIGKAMDMSQVAGGTPMSGAGMQTASETMTDKFALPRFTAQQALQGAGAQAVGNLWGAYPNEKMKSLITTPTTQATIFGAVPKMEKKLGYETTMQPDTWGAAGSGLQFLSQMPNILKGISGS